METIGIGQGLQKEADLWVLPARSSYSTTAEEWLESGGSKTQENGRR
jgi:hypothetical protein